MAIVEPLNILVITHNGRPPGPGPNQGGLRIGYQVGNMFLNLATGEWQRVKTEEEMKKEQREAERAKLRAGGIIIYDELPRTNRWGDCVNCERGITSKKIMKTDQGDEELVVCRSCGQKMRPYRY